MDEVEVETRFGLLMLLVEIPWEDLDVLVVGMTVVWAAMSTVLVARKWGRPLSWKTSRSIVRSQKPPIIPAVICAPYRALKFLVDRQESILSSKSLHPLFNPMPISPHTANDSSANRPDKNTIAIDIALGENSSFLRKIIHKKIKNSREKTAVTAAATMGKRQKPLL